MANKPPREFELRNVGNIFPLLENRLVFTKRYEIQVGINGRYPALVAFSWRRSPFPSEPLAFSSNPEIEEADITCKV